MYKRLKTEYFDVSNILFVVLNQELIN